MTQTINRLVEHIIDQAGELGIQAEAAPDGACISGAECVIHLRDCQRCLTAATDSLRHTIANRTAEEKPVAMFQ